MKKYLFLISSLFLSLEAKEICDFTYKEKNNICLELEKNNVDVKYIKNYFNTNNVLTHKQFEILHYDGNKNINNKLENSEHNLNLLKNHLNEYKTIYEDVEKKYSINKEVIASILLYETKLGKEKLRYTNKDFNVFFNYDDETLKKFKYKEITNIIKNTINFCYFNKITEDKCNFKTSKNGDFGLAQFSSNNLNYIVPINNDYDLNNMEVSIYSLANLLEKSLKIEKINYNEFKNNDEFSNYVLNKYNKNQKYIIEALITSYYLNKYNKI